ncbi:stalk domain-containing protein [Peptoniphilus sp. Marseille-Q6390]
MNRKMFSLVTSFAILSSSFSPAWAAGKNFTYNNLEKSLAIHAEAKEVKSSEAKEKLPLVTETMPDDSVKDKYFMVIFTPQTKMVNGSQKYGKLKDKNGIDIPLKNISYELYSDKYFYKGKNFYALKSASWGEILKHVDGGDFVKNQLVADNDENDTEKKKDHEFVGWYLKNEPVNPFDPLLKIDLLNYEVNKPLIFKSRFKSLEYFYSNLSSQEFDIDGYPIKNYKIIRFSSKSEVKSWRTNLSLNDYQKKFSDPSAFKSKDIYFYVKNNSGIYNLKDFIPEAPVLNDKAFWFWSQGYSYKKANDKIDTSKDLDRILALYIGEYFNIGESANLEETPLPKGFYEVRIKTEGDYRISINTFNYNIIAVKEGNTLNIVPDFPTEPKLKDKNNVEYKGKVAWYDGYTKIDDISTVKIDSDKVFTARRVRDFESEKFNPVVKDVEVNLNEDVSPKKLKDGITNLPENVEVEIKTRADTSKVVKTKAVLKLIFSDSSSKEVEVPVKVVDKISGKIITPIPTIKSEDIIKEEVLYKGKVDLSDNIKNLPDGAKVKDVSDPINTKTPGSYVGKVKVTFKGGSSRIVEIPVEVLAPLAEKFPAQMPEKTPVEKLESLSASEKSEIIEKVKKANPQASSVEVSDRGEVTLVYTDGSKNIISPKDTIVLKEKESYKKDPEDKPGKAEDGKDPEDKPGKEDKRDPEENIEEAKDKKENNLDSWNEFPRYYVRDHKTPTYKVEVKTNSQVSQTKTQVNPKKFVIDINSGTYTLTEDGKTLEKSMEVKPIIENNRTMLPLRALAEILGAKVIWNDATRTASFTRDGLTALIQIDGSKIVLSNGKTIDLEAKPLNVNGRIYLPLVYVGQVFGLTSGNADDDKENDIEWKEESKTVTINIK